MTKPIIKIASWNVNGIRACLKKGFINFLSKYKPDILCLQEIKVKQKDFPDFAGRDNYYLYVSDDVPFLASPFLQPLLPKLH